MSTALETPGRVLLLREVATSPVAATFVAERMAPNGSSLAAVKVLKKPADPSLVVGLQEQSARLSALRQRHIVCPEQVLDIDGHLGLLYPYVDGVDLLDWLEVLRETNTKMPPRVVCELLRGVTVALDAALNRIPWGESRPLHMFHCDIKPSNLMVDRDGELKVLDFGTGTSRLSGEDLSSIDHRGRVYMAPERRLGRPPSHPADIYAVGLLGIELLRNRWIRNLPTANPEHDIHLGKVVRQIPLNMRSSADEQTLRSLLLRMAAYSPASRPAANGAAQTLRRLADRAPGPSLESFAHAHALPWLGTVPRDPDTALMVQVTPIQVDVTGRLPRAAKEFTEEDTNTMSLGGLKGLLHKSSPQFFLRDAGWDNSEELDTLAEETEKALNRARVPRYTEELDPYEIPTITHKVPIEVIEDTEVEVIAPRPRINEWTEEVSPPPTQGWVLLVAAASMLGGFLVASGAVIMAVLLLLGAILI